jgi:anti-anti-sigma regulatory factor
MERSVAMSTAGLLPALRVVRRPGEVGPVLSCAGDLTAATVEILARELELLVELPHPVLTVDLAGCRYKELDGMLALLKTLRQLGEKDRRVVLVAGTGWMASLVGVSGIDELLPVFPNEEEAARTLRLMAPPLPMPAGWEEARANAVAYWQDIREALDLESPEEVLAYLTAMTALCERAEKRFRQRLCPATWRCQLCPLFHALGRRPHAVGCRSLQDPLIDAVRAGDRVSARALIDATIGFLQELPLPETELLDEIPLGPGTRAPGKTRN